MKMGAPNVINDMMKSDGLICQKSAPSVINDVGRAAKNALLKITDFQYPSGWIPLMGGHPICGKKISF